jgi:hypothetical protein
VNCSIRPADIMIKIIAVIIRNKFRADFIKNDNWKNILPPPLSKRGAGGVLSCFLL